MEIAEIKRRLSIKEVLARYGLAPDKNGMMRCPFHNDRTPSMRVYEDTGTVYCFSGNCKLHGRAIDGIDLIMEKEGTTKHEAIEKAKTLVGSSARDSGPAPRKEKGASPQDMGRIAVLSKVTGQATEGIARSDRAMAYCRERGLDPGKVGAGFLGARHHHGWNAEMKRSATGTGLLKERPNGQTSPVFGGCLVFATKDEEGRPTGLYGRSIKGKGHYYLKGEHRGLYPKYPESSTKKLILTESIIDAATLLQHPAITEHYGILALYGTNGLTGEHEKAIRSLQYLEEIVFLMDGDEAGHKATERYSEELHGLLPKVKFSKGELPEGEDVNSLMVGHEPEVMGHILRERAFLFSNETSNEKEEKPETSPYPGEKELDTTDPDRITWETEDLKITIWGGIEYSNLHRLKLSLHLEDTGSGHTPEGSGRAFRDDVNLYSNRSRKTFLGEAGEELERSRTELKKLMESFTEAVEAHRMKKRKAFRERKRPSVPELSEEERKEALRPLKDGDLTKHLRKAMERTGLIGETGNGLLLFLIFLTRFFDNPLHALVHGSSGSGKTNLLKSVLKLVPQESKYETTALTENVLFRPPHKDFWKHRILLLEDLDGSYKALLPLREFMSNQYISKFSSEPDPRTGKFEQVHLEAHGPLVIAGATTKDRVYEDNSNRSFLLHVNEDREHQRRILEHQNKEAAGLIDQGDTEKLLRKVHNVQRMLDPKVKVVNPFQPELRLPEHVFKKLRTNTHYITLIKAVTFLHQYQREKKKDTQGSPYIETTLEDVALANELSKHSLLRKSDELSGQVRDFFESLKRLLEEEGKESFLAKDVRARLRMHPMKFSRYVNELKDRGYVKKTAGKEKGSFEYRIEVWDDYRAIKKGLSIMDRVLEDLYERYPDGTYQKEEITVNREEITSSREKQKAPSIKGSNEEITK